MEYAVSIAHLANRAYKMGGRFCNSQGPFKNK